MNKIIYLPLDERPCNYDFVIELGKMTSKYEVIAPNLDILGKKKTPSCFNEIKHFLLEHAKDAKAYIISLDQLLYGGIVPSRLHHLSIDEVKERLSVLKEIKKINQNVSIYCNVLIMRCPKYSSSDEEPDYYETYGESIHELGVKIHRDGLKEISEDIKPFLDDYLQRRNVNKQAIFEIIKMKDDLIDYLVIPQDDSHPYGFTTLDRNEIIKQIKVLNKDVLLYPGADEIGLTLLSKAINDLEHHYKKIYVDYLYPSSKDLIPAYENKRLEDTIFKQIKAAGNILTDELTNADIVICVNYPSKLQLESSTDNRPIFGDEVNKQFTTLKKAKELGKVICLVDKYFVNGGCFEYVDALHKSFGLHNLDVYTGWNTSSNSLGTAISVSTIISYFNFSIYSRKFLCSRVYDDLIYQAYVRKYIVDNVARTYGFNYFNAGEEKGIMAKLIFEEINKIAKNSFDEIYNECPLKCASLPWKRFFEIRIEV